MYSNRESESISSHDSEDTDHSKELEAIRPIALENCIEADSNSSKMMKETSTQTSLTMFRFTLIRESVDKRFVDSTTSPARIDRMSGNKMHPSLAHSKISTPRDVLQVSTSFLSNKSGIKNEVLTVTTDYGNPSTDTRSMVVDAINQNGNRSVHASVQETYEASHTMELPLPSADSMRNNLFRHTTDHRSWFMRSLNSCLRCTANNERDTHPYVRDAPPAYSTMYANQGTTMRNWRPFRSENQLSFVAPVPPPSYAQAQGICLGSCSLDDLLSTSPNRSRFWSPRPTTAICSRCTTIVVTTIEVHQSMSTHITALALFLCGCWPCCMIPYCMNACKNIDHRCPICRAYLGTYRPW